MSEHNAVATAMLESIRYQSEPGVAVFTDNGPVSIDTEEYRVDWFSRSDGSIPEIFASIQHMEHFEFVSALGLVSGGKAFAVVPGSIETDELGRTSATPRTRPFRIRTVAVVTSHAAVQATTLAEVADDVPLEILERCDGTVQVDLAGDMVVLMRAVLTLAEHRRAQS